MTISEKIAEYILLLIPTILVLYKVGIDGATFVIAIFIAVFLINHHE